MKILFGFAATTMSALLLVPTLSPAQAQAPAVIEARLAAAVASGPCLADAGSETRV